MLAKQSNKDFTNKKTSIVDQAVSTLPDITFDRYHLPNGLEVILHQRTATPIVHVLLWYHVGSKDEPADRTGFAHLFEHMMFQGSKNVGKTEHFTWIQGIGGVTNASTSQDRTNYFQTVPREYLGLALWLEADRMRSLNVSEENFQNQLSVVKEERKQRYDNQPYGLLYLTMLEMVFQGSSYGWGPIGDMAHLDAAPLRTVQEFHQQFYVPNNAVLILAGDFEPEEARRLIAEQFGNIPAGAAIQRRFSPAPPLTQQVRRTITDQVPFPSVTIGFRAAPIGHPDQQALALLTNILSGGTSSRFQQSIVHDQQLALHAYALALPQERDGMLLIQARAMHGVSAEKLEAALWEELEKLRTDGCTQHELDAALNRTEASLVRGLGSAQSVADMLAQFHVFQQDPARVNRLLDEYRAVTVGDLQRVAQHYLSPSSAAVLHYLPEEWD